MKNLRDLDGANHFINIDGKFGFKTERDTIINAIYEDYGFLDGDLITMKNSNGWILLDTIGRRLTGEFDTIMHFSNRSISIVKKNNKYGIIDRSGKYIKRAKYRELNYFVYDAVAIICRMRNKYGILNLQGEKIVNAKYHLVNPSTYYYNKCFLFYEQNGNYLYIDDYGNKYAGE